MAVGLTLRKNAIDDLKKIKAGQMDPAGETILRKAKKTAEWGFLLGLAFLVLWGCLGILVGFGTDWFDSLSK
jgi:hypothetical protein